MMVICYSCVFLYIILTLFISESIKPILNKHCGIDFLKIPKRTLLKQEGENYRLLKEDNWDNLRIHMDFSFIENNIGKFDKQDLIDLKEKIMPKTQKVLQSLLKVKKIQNKLKLNHNTCDDIQIPEHYQSEGVDADLVIFVLIDDTGFFLKNKIEAGAVHCLQHEQTRRPVAGYIQFKPQLSVNNSTALDYMVWLAVHEVSHILVMNNVLYEDYINPETLEPLGLDNVIRRKITESGKKINLIKSPKVVEKAKSHYNCTHLDGVPLEYNGGEGTAGAHWAKKYMNTDYMIGDSYGENLISDITLGLFEDSGWYKVDYELANLFLWGKNASCSFFDMKKKCIEKNKENNQTKISVIEKVENGDKHGKINLFIVNNQKQEDKDLIKKNGEKAKNNIYLTNFKNEFCTNFNYPVCSTSNIFRGVCSVRKFTFKLLQSERYFTNPHIGGADSLVEKCPIPIEEKGDQSYYGGSCRVGNNETLILNDIEKICPECACFMSNLNDGNLKHRIDAAKAKSTTKKMKKNVFQKTNLTVFNFENKESEPKKNNMRKANSQISIAPNKKEDSIQETGNFKNKY